MPILSATKLGADRDKEKDFSKKKRKVGKTNPDAENLTKTNISSKSLIMPQQNLRPTGTNEHDDGAQLIEVLEKLTHTNGTMRAETLTKLGQLFTKSPSLLLDHLQYLLPHFGESMSDEDSSVRTALCHVLYAHLPSVMPELIRPFFDVFLQYIMASLNNILPPIRDDSIHFLRLVAVLYPMLLSRHALTLLVNLSALLSEKELFSHKAGATNKNFQFPHQFIHCKLQYWHSIYERIVAVNPTISGDNEDNTFNTQNATISAHQQAIADINKRIQAKYGIKSKSSPFLDEGHIIELCERNLIQLPNGAVLSNIQTLLFTVQIILKNAIPSHTTTTLNESLYQSQLSHPMRIPNMIGVDNSIDASMITSTTTNTTNNTNTQQQQQDVTPPHLRLITPLQTTIIEFDDGAKSTRQLMAQSLNLLKNDPINRSPGNNKANGSNTTNSSSTQIPNDLNVLQASQYSVKSATTSPLTLLLHLQPVLHNVLKAMLSCWDSYAPHQWSKRSTNPSNHDIYEHEDMKSIFAGSQLSRSGPSQRHRGKLAKDKSNEKAAATAALTTPLEQQQHSYSLLVSIVASMYYLSRLDLQCRVLVAEANGDLFEATIGRPNNKNTNKNKINNNTLNPDLAFLLDSDELSPSTTSAKYRALSMARLRKGKAILLPFGDVEQFNIINVSPLQFFPFRSDESHTHLVLSELNTWTVRLISLILPCVPARLDENGIKNILLAQQRESLMKRMDELGQVYYHARTQVITYINDHKLQLNQTSMKNKIDSDERARLMNRFNHKKDNDNHNHNKKMNKNVSSSKGKNVTMIDGSRGDQEIQPHPVPDQYLLPDSCPEVNTIPIFAEYRTMYQKYHKQLGAMEKFKNELSKNSQEILAHTSTSLNIMVKYQNKLIAYISDAIDIYGQQDNAYAKRFQQRTLKHQNESNDHNDDNNNNKGTKMIKNDNNKMGKSTQVNYKQALPQGAMKRTRQVQEDDGEVVVDTASTTKSSSSSPQLIDVNPQDDDEDKVVLGKPLKFIGDSDHFDAFLYENDPKTTSNKSTLTTNNGSGDLGDHDGGHHDDSSFDNSACIPQFRDFLELFWSVLPSLPLEPRTQIITLYSAFYQSLSITPLSTTKLLAVLPLLLLPESQYGGKYWYKKGFVTQWSQSLCPLIQAALRVATLQRGAWLLSGSQGHKLLKLINWEFLLTSISTTLFYISLRYPANDNITSSPSHSLTSLLLSQTTNTNPSITPSYQFGPLLHALYWSTQQITLGKVINQASLPISFHFFKSFTVLIATNLLSTTSLSKFTQDALSFIVSTQLKFPTNIAGKDNHTKGDDKHQSPPSTTSITPLASIVTTPQSYAGLSVSTTQYLQDITLLHHTLTKESKLEFLFSSLFSQKIVLEQPNLLKGTNKQSTKSNQDTHYLPPIQLISMNDDQDVVIGTILHLMKLCLEAPPQDSSHTNPQSTTITKSSFLRQSFLPMVNMKIDELYKIDFIHTKGREQEVIIASINATKMIQLIFMFYTFIINTSSGLYDIINEQDRTQDGQSSNGLLVDIIEMIKQYTLWYTILGFSLQHNQLLASLDVTITDCDMIKDSHNHGNNQKISKSSITNTSSSSTTTLTKQNQNSSTYGSFVAKFHAAKQSQAQKAQFHGLNPLLVPSLQRILPFLTPLTPIVNQTASHVNGDTNSHHNRQSQDWIINALRNNTPSTLDFSTHSIGVGATSTPSPSLFGGQFALGIISHDLLGLDAIDERMWIDMMKLKEQEGGDKKKYIAATNPKMIKNTILSQFGFKPESNTNITLLSTLLAIIGRLIDKMVQSRPDIGGVEMKPFGDIVIGFGDLSLNEKMIADLMTNLLPSLNLDTIYSLLTALLSITPLQNAYVNILETEIGQQSQEEEEQQQQQSTPQPLIEQYLFQLCHYGAYTSSPSYDGSGNGLSIPIFSGFCQVAKGLIGFAQTALQYSSTSMISESSSSSNDNALSFDFDSY